MELTTDLKIGQVVKSKAGRDKGRVFVICEKVDESYVLVCDGDLRKLKSPKKKKIKHLVIYNTVLTEFAEKLQNNKNLNDAFIRSILITYNNNASKEWRLSDQCPRKM
ncbi:KOW domain-containing RNA-binding protein [Sedimentibacter sp. MB31-C6]|uniref:KOW domain-containing RNA-binding protein n=1 Tax=Sedimentibacter sp. MB31-C6 TaxID=3109366 RepID=UPI002DDDA8F6|nr:KOW domain-containing RNA-binding protein [Sedimentibacter sp. MB36-C1]WSI03880.1 KOW domain-containing RNA-binding protein [Sedimentibacter sp. MB36-C1]